MDRDEGAEPVHKGLTRVLGHAYPWDVIGDPEFVARVIGLGLDEVSLAATYHGTRAATPLHPQHRLMTAPQAALYRPVRESAWAGGSLRPVPASWVDAADPFATAARSLQAGGVRVNAWVVLAHSSRLGALRPDLVVENCFGDRYSYALCPSRDEVVDYATTLAVEAVRGVAVAGVSVEGLGQLGVAHNGPHEKTDGAYGPAAQRLLSVCCCDGCQQAWTAAGLDPHWVVDRLRDGLLEVQDGAHDDDAAMADVLGDELAAALLTTRFASQSALQASVLDALADAEPGARITLHGQVDPWATGPSPAVAGTLTAGSARAVDAVLVPAWPATPATYAAVTAARRLAPVEVSVAAYVTVLPPADPGTVRAHARAVVEAGADELHLYHLGLANRAQLDVVGDIAHVARHPPADR
jgi:hypothetical protein